MVDGEDAAPRLAVLPSKIVPPRLAHQALERTALRTRIDGSPARCVVVVAPAGYGKTILLRQSADGCRHPTAWITADETDADPLALTAALVESLRMVIDPSELMALLTRRTPADLRTEVLPALGSAVAAAPPFVLIVDDVHLVEADESLDVVERLIDCLPDGARLVIAARSVPHLRLARRRLAEPVLELGADDLALSVEEAATFLRSRLGAELSDAAVTELFERTEGWPAGLQLAALALHDHPDPDGALQTLVTKDASFVDYVEEEMLSGLSDADQDLLVQTSILERLTPSLCDAVTRAGGGTQLLDHLIEAGNLFIVPLEDASTYRYHHLFGELLQQRLQRADPELEPELHRRASTWMLAHGDPEGAVRHGLASGDVAFAADIVYQLLFPAIERGGFSALQRWLAEFPSGDLRRRAPLLLARGWAAVSAGRSTEVAEVLRLLDDADEPGGTLPDGTISLEVATAALHTISGGGGVKDLVGWASVVVDAGPSGSPWWGLAVYLRAVAEHLMEPDDDGIARFDQAERATRGESAIHAVALAHQGFVRLMADDASGYAIVDEAVDELRESGSEQFTLAVLVYTVQAYADAKRGRVASSADAARRAGEMLDVVGDAVPRGVAHQSLILADAALLRHDVAAAIDELGRARTMLPLEPDAVRLHDWADRVARRTSSRRDGSGGAVVAHLSPAELRVLEQLRTHRSLEEIGTHLYVSRNTVKSHTIAIYRKLGVSGRSAAVERAQALGLLTTRPT